VALVAAIMTASDAVCTGQTVPSDAGFSERVDVARIMLDVRVVGRNGQPVHGLGPEDFRVSIDRQPARVESVQWIGIGAAGASPDQLPDDQNRAPYEAEPGGRLIVFLFQKDLHPSRIVGLMRMLRESRGLVATLRPLDRVAILSFDTHLNIWVDFTNDRERLRGILEDGVLLRLPPEIDDAGTPLSLARRLRADEARRTYEMAHGLRLIAEALEPLPGIKSLVVVGHGFGRYDGGRVSLDADYDEALDALHAARVTVFSLDVTDADTHSLEIGLQHVSGQTGGFFARTHEFPVLAMTRLAGALSGSYVLFVEAPVEQVASHAVDVQLSHREGTVLAAPVTRPSR